MNHRGWAQMAWPQAASLLSLPLLLSVVPEPHSSNEGPATTGQSLHTASQLFIIPRLPALGLSHSDTCHLSTGSIFP